MIDRRLVRLESRQRYAVRHRLTAEREAAWIEGRRTKVRLQPRRKLLTTIRHDGCGKFDPVLYVSPGRAVRLVSRQWDVSFRSLRPFPRIAVSAFRLKSMQDAQAAVEALLLEQGSLR